MVWRQRDATGAGSWALPTGIAEGDEDPSLTAARSVHAVAKVQPTGLHCVMDFQHLTDVIDGLQVLFVGSSEAAAPMRFDEADGRVAEWIPLSELPQLAEDGKVTGIAMILAILAVLAREGSDVLRSLKRVNLSRSGS